MKKKWSMPIITILNLNKTAGGTNWQAEYTHNNGKLSNGTATTPTS